MKYFSCVQPLGRGGPLSQFRKIKETEKRMGCSASTHFDCTAPSTLPVDPRIPGRTLSSNYEKGKQAMFKNAVYLMHVAIRNVGREFYTNQADCGAPGCMGMSHNQMFRVLAVAESSSKVSLFTSHPGSQRMLVDFFNSQGYSAVMSSSSVFDYDHFPFCVMVTLTGAVEVV